jgi:hypothetical protein
MIISHELRFVYIGIPRTGSKSMMAWLHAHFPANYARGGHGHRYDVPD